MMDLSYYKGKKVLITGHTGFKGSWLSYILVKVGADVIGYSLENRDNPNLYDLLNLENDIRSFYGDVADLGKLKKVFEISKPEIVFHLAAQPIVRESYQNPVWTYQTNVMGTVNILECIRKSISTTSFLNVTTDKVYRNKEWEWGYRENEELCGYDPYSNSKSCSELVTYSYQKSFFQDKKVAISTARAGNVIGGGDFAVDRIVPDCFRACEKSEDIIVRNPYSIRPYQHVLEPLMSYLMLAALQNEKNEYADNYNIGPDEIDCVCTGQLVSNFCHSWEKYSGKEPLWIKMEREGPHEANYLKLDCSKFKNRFGWRPVWHIETAIDKAVEWYYGYMCGEDIKKIMEQQINEYIEGMV